LDPIPTAVYFRFLFNTEAGVQASVQLYDVANDTVLSGSALLTGTTVTELTSADILGSMPAAKTLYQVRAVITSPGSPGATDVINIHRAELILE